MIKETIIAVALFGSSALTGQRYADSSTFIPHISASYAFQLPGGDMAKRFGWNSNIGLNVDFKLANHLVLGVQGCYIFGSKVEENTIQGIQTKQDQLINKFGQYGLWAKFERGGTFMGYIGYRLPAFGSNQNSGLELRLGLGYMIHKIKFDNERSSVPQIDGEYAKLYDRLTHGYSTMQYFGYTHISSNGLTNFNIGLEFHQGFTKGKRDFQADTQSPYLGNRLDLLYGIRFGWIIPFRSRTQQEYYLN